MSIDSQYTMGVLLHAAAVCCYTSNYSIAEDIA